MTILHAPLNVQPSHPSSAYRHPRGSKARVLLTSVFGPYAQDDEYGSRSLNPMELYHNQVTRVQGPFSLRMFHRSWGLMMIQANIQAPCTLLDFPTRDRFIDELKSRTYDVIGISSIPLNIGKVREMCRLIRRYQPNAEIVIGGHIANIPDLDERLDADHIVRGEGVRWFRRYLGEDENQVVRHPEIVSGFGTRCMGVQLKDKPGSTAATLVPSVGCPMGCNFCSTSAMFGGKGKSVDFYPTGEALFDVMNQLADSMNIVSFFVADENFLLYRKRALKLLELMERHDKAWTLYVFSSANVLRTYTMDQLIRLGISWVWLGLEGKNSQYSKLRNIDTFELVREFQSHGIHVLGSTIIGLEEHTPENMEDVIEYAARHETDFHQFMLYTPVAGTPLHEELTSQGRMKDESAYDPADIHGQYIFNYRHPNIPDGLEAEFIKRAFERDFERNGPSLMRLVRTTLNGYQRYKDHPDPRVRRRIAWSAESLPDRYVAAVWAARRFYRHNPPQHARLTQLLKDLYAEFGVRARAAAAFGGPYVLWNLLREDRRLRNGWTYEPSTFYEVNDAAAQDAATPRGTGRCRSVAPRSGVPHPAAENATPVELSGSHLPSREQPELIEPVAVSRP